MTARTRRLLGSIGLVIGAVALALCWSHLLVEAEIRNAYDTRVSAP